VGSGVNSQNKETTIAKLLYLKEASFEKNG
jgi:hypothetical protein